MEEGVPAATHALVGRRREQREVRAAIDLALSGSGTLVLVTGEAGIGKTRLVETVTRSLSAHLLWGICWADPGTPAYWAWTSVLRDCVAATALEPDPDVAPVLGGGKVPHGPSELIRLRLFDAIATFLGAAARIRPLVIVLEDLHVADRASLDLLRFLASALRRQPVAIVGTCRYPDLDPGRPLEQALPDLSRTAVTVPLRGLDDEEVAELVAAIVGTRPTAPVATRMRDLTGGNPMFALEVASLLVSRGSLDHEGLTLPPSVHEVVRHRLGLLSADTRAVLSHAAVVGRVFAVPLLAHAIGRPPADILDHLDEAASAGLVQEGQPRGTFVFAHALVHEVLYAGIPRSARRGCHRRIARSIEELHPLALDDRVGELAAHYVKSLPDGDPVLALDYTRRAASQALGMSAYGEAADHLRRAVELAAEGAAGEATRIELQLELGDALMRAGDPDGATATYEDVAASARRRGRADELARAALGLGAGLSGFEVRLFDGRQIDLLREALEQLGDDDEELRAWVLARLSVAESFVETDEVRSRRSIEALVLARRVDDPKLLAYALGSYCDTIGGPAHTEERLALAGEMIRLGIEAQDPESELLGRRFRIVALMESGDLRGVRAEVDVFARVAEQLRWSLVAWYPLVWRGVLSLVEGRIEECAALLPRIREIGDHAGSVNARILADVLAMQLALERGHPEEAYEFLRPLLEDPEAGPNAEAWRGLPLTRMGRRAEATAVIDRLAEAGYPLVMDAAWLEVVAGVAEACAESGHAAGAARLLPIVAPFADRFATGAIGAICFGSMHRHVGLLAHCTGDLETAAGHFNRALIANRAAGATLLIAHTQRQYAALLRARLGAGDAQAAADLLAEAVETYHQLGLSHWTASTPDTPSFDHAVLRLEGDVWLVAFRNREARVRPVKGMAVLGRLLAEPGREFHVLDLAAPQGRVEPRPADTGPVIDERARRAYQQRLTELEAEIDELTTSGDAVRAEQARAEREALVGQLTAAYGLAGRPRRGNDPVERARSTVSKQVRSAITRIESVHPELALHLTNSIRTGRFCSYVPETSVTWTR